MKRGHVALSFPFLLALSSSLDLTLTFSLSLSLTHAYTTTQKANFHHRTPIATPLVAMESSLRAESNDTKTTKIGPS